jgi:hypothetical protein
MFDNQVCKNGQSRPAKVNKQSKGHLKMLENTSVQAYNFVQRAIKTI